MSRIHQSKGHYVDFLPPSTIRYGVVLPIARCHWNPLPLHTSPGSIFSPGQLDRGQEPLMLACSCHRRTMPKHHVVLASSYLRQKNIIIFILKLQLNLESFCINKKGSKVSDLKEVKE